MQRLYIHGSFAAPGLAICYLDRVGKGYTLGSIPKVNNVAKLYLLDYCEKAADAWFSSSPGWAISCQDRTGQEQLVVGNNWAFIKTYIITRPSVAGAVLQTPPSFIQSFIHVFIRSPFSAKFCSLNV